MRTIVAVMAILSVGLVECQQRPRSAPTDEQKLGALNDALKSGLITQDEYDAKVGAIKGNGTAARRTPAQAQIGQLQPFPINDPVLQMQAWTLMAPANWNVEGTMLPGSSCVDGTTPTYRAVSPDGLTGAYFLPRTDWAWGPAVRAADDCRPWPRQVTARDFLNGFINTQVLNPVRDLPVPELEEARGKDVNSPGFRSNTDMARELVSYSVDGHPIEEWVTATVQCIDKVAMGVGQQHNCSAFIKRWFAPAGQLQAIIPMFQTMKLTLNQQWMNQWTVLMRNKINGIYGPETQRLLQQGELAHAERMHAHEDFMANMQAEGDKRKDLFEKHMYDKQRQSDNFVDYVLDCQRYYSSNGNYRVSAGYNCPNRQTWQ